MRPMLGRHAANLPDPIGMTMDFLKYVWIAQLIYTFVIASTKFAVLAFYWRLFSINARTTIWVVSGMCAAWWVSIVSVSIHSLTGNNTDRPFASCCASSSAAYLFRRHGTSLSQEQSASLSDPYTWEDPFLMLFLI